MRGTLIFLILCSMIMSIFTIVYPVEICQAGDILTVGSGPGYDYDTIQGAIDAANPNDTINVYSSGSPYNENLEVTIPLTITGVDGSSSTTINGVSSSKHTISISSDNASISGFTIRNTAGSAQSYSCVLLSGTSESCTISSNIIKDGGNGIYIVTSTNNIITGNTIEDQSENGISFTTQGNQNQIYNNIIRENLKNGIKLFTSSENTFYDNTISDNILNGVSLAGSANNNVFYRNNFYENSDGNANDAGSNTWYSGTQGNTWSDYDDYDSDGDGKGDSPYTNGGVNDLYPLGVFKDKPEAYIDSISPNPATEGHTVVFSGHSTGEGSIIDWQWRAGDNVIGYQEDLEYSGLAPGTYTISFRVKNSDNKWSEWTFYVGSLVINPSGGVEENNPPEAILSSINPHTALFGETILFSGSGIDLDDGDIIKDYYWSSSIDGYLSDQPSFSRNDLSVGNHTIYFKVKDNHDEWSSVKSQTLKISVNTSIDNDPPVADAGGPYASYTDDIITFDASDSYDSDGTIVTYSWDFGNGNTSTGKTATNAYSQSGEFVVVLTVTDNYGFTDTDNTYATVLVDPTTGNGGTNGDDNNNNNGSDDDNGKWVIPGFETIIVIIGLIIIAIIRKTWKK